MSQCFVRKVSNHDSLIEDLGADSLDTVELVMALEKISVRKGIYLMYRRDKR